MSLNEKALRWAHELIFPRMAPRHRSVLLALAFYVDDCGVTAPPPNQNEYVEDLERLMDNVPTIANLIKDTGFGGSTVMKSILELEQRSIVLVQRQWGAANQYKLNFKWMDERFINAMTLKSINTDRERII